MQARKWVIGNEYDKVVFARLKRALGDLHYLIRDQWSGLAGSRDIQQWTAVSPSGQLTIERDIRRPFGRRAASLIDDLQARYEQTV